jgi:hypothetical protein
MPDDALDTLYAADPADFTALRTKLAGEAKKRGDADAAKRLSGARKPTAAAHAVNVLVLNDPAVCQRLSALGERLRTAHAEMDGERIRELTAEQRKLIDELSRAAFAEAGQARPSAALRDDVVATLQAAVADPDVAARLGRLVKAEQWSGFGGFGDSAVVFTPKSKPKKPAPASEESAGGDPKTSKAAPSPERDGTREARAAVAAAEHAKAEADRALAELQSDLATARMRRDDARRRLQDAEQALAAAEDAYEKGKQAGREAGAAVKSAKADLLRRGS